MNLIMYNIKIKSLFNVHVRIDLSDKVMITLGRVF